MTSTRDKYSSYLPPTSSIHVVTKSSKVWMVLSVCPSVCGWNAMLNFNSIPIAFWILGHNLDMNLGSRSNIIDIGTPCNLTTSLTYNLTMYVINIIVVMMMMFVGLKPMMIGSWLSYEIWDTRSVNRVYVDNLGSPGIGETLPKCWWKFR